VLCHEMSSTPIIDGSPEEAAISWKNKWPYITELSSRPERSGVERSAVSFLHASLKSTQVGFCLLDKPYLLRAAPSLDLLFPVNGIVYVPIALIPNQAMASVIGCEIRNDSLPMFLSPSPHTIRHTDIRDVRPVSDDVDVIVMFSHCFNGLRAK
jgi:hypothetical protein